MNNPFQPEDPQLQEAIDSAFADLKGFHADSDEYKKITAQLKELYALKPDRRPALDPNKLILVLGNVYVGLKVLNFEQTGIVTTKLWSFMSKM